jgi:hypothetical protein
MGTDIYLYVEEQREDGWHFLGTLAPNPYPITEAEAIEPAWRPVSDDDGRNDVLFRFCGFDRLTRHEATDDLLPMIASLRGIPQDLSPEIHAWRQYFEPDVRGSWLLLSEVLAFPWQQARRKEAMVSPAVAPLFADPTAPFPLDRWPADEPISYSAYRRGGVTVQWTETYAESAGSFLTELAIPLRQRHPRRVIRCVFWFE